jgi:acyl-lipid (8-3)-desaturase
MGADAGDLRSYRLADIANHNTPEDCWLIIDNGVYDVSSFVSLHPGGDIITVRAGGDCSDLFASYHPLRTRLEPINVP